MAAGPPLRAPRPAVGAERCRTFPSVPRSPEEPGSRAGGSGPAPEPGSGGAGAGEGRPDVSGAAISCFSAVFPSFGWWLPLGSGVPSAEGEAAWTAAPAPRALPPAAARPPARFSPSSPPFSSAPGRRRRRGPASGPDAGHQVCGGGRWVGIWLDLLTAPSGGSPGALPPWSPWGSPLPADRGVPRRQPEEPLPFSPRAQREPQGWAAHSFTLCPTHPGNCLGGE